MTCIEIHKRLLALAGVVVAIVFVTAGPASAHAVLLTTQPQPGGTYDESPRSIDLRFSEPVEASLGGIRLFDGDANRVVTGAPRHPGGSGTEVRASVPNLEDGTYVVTWRVTSADSHPIEGAFTFQVGATASVKDADSLAARLLSSQGGSTAVGIAYAIDRAAVFASLALLIGSAVFLVAVFPRGRSIARARVLVWAGWSGALVTTLVAIPLEGVYAAALPLSKVFDPQVWGDVLDTRYGRVALIRLALLAIAFPLLRKLLARGDPSPPFPFWWLIAASLTGIGLSLTPALAGHASAGDYVAIAIPADTIHVGAMSCWLGGLVVLFAVVLPRRDANEMRGVLPRFSALALGAVVALVVTGSFQAWRQVGSLEALKETDFGRTLIVKLVVFAALIVAAAFSREVVNRRFREYDDEAGEPSEPAFAPEPVSVGAGPGASPGSVSGSGPARAHASAGGDSVGPEIDDPEMDDEVRRLRRSVFAEVIIATVVIAVTALLVNAAPGRTTTAEPVALTLQSPKLWVDATIAPGTAGGNDIHLTAFAVGGGLTTVEDMQVLLTQPGGDLAPFTVPLQKLGPNHYFSPLYNIPYPGEWQMTIRARIGPTDEAVLTGRFTLR